MKVMAALTWKASLSASERAEQKQGERPNKSSVQEIHGVGSWPNEPGHASCGKSDSGQIRNKC